MVRAVLGLNPPADSVQSSFLPQPQNIHVSLTGPNWFKIGQWVMIMWARTVICVHVLSLFALPLTLWQLGQTPGLPWKLQDPPQPFFFPSITCPLSDLCRKKTLLCVNFQNFHLSTSAALAYTKLFNYFLIPFNPEDFFLCPHPDFQNRNTAGIDFFLQLSVFCDSWSDKIIFLICQQIPLFHISASVQSRTGSMHP